MKSSVGDGSATRQRAGPRPGRQAAGSARCGGLAALIALLLASCEEQTPPPAEGRSDWSAHAAFVPDVATPFWESSRQLEPLFFLQEGPESRPAARLLFRPEKLVTVRSADRSRTFAPGRDYLVDLETGVLELPPGSRIPFMTAEALYPPVDSGERVIAARRDDPSRGIFFAEGAVYHGLQVEVVYDAVPGQWKGWAPGSAADTLPRTFARLRAAEPVTLLLSGDSVSAGCNATLFIDAPPHQPAYPDLVAAGLASHYGGRVVVHNNAVGGWRASQGWLQARQWRLGRQQPDLVIIAYGSNDLSVRDAEEYRDHVAGIIESIRRDSPDAEFLLIATMIGNVEWSKLPEEQFRLYRDALAELAGPGVAFADMTSIWEEILSRKSYYDTTGNGVNHPNDYGHRIYAQVILRMLR